MLRSNGRGNFVPYGKFTVPARKSGDLREAHEQTRAGQLIALGLKPFPLRKEDTERREYAKPKDAKKAEAEVDE